MHTAIQKKFWTAFSPGKCIGSLMIWSYYLFGLCCQHYWLTFNIQSSYPAQFSVHSLFFDAISSSYGTLHPFFFFFQSKFFFLSFQILINLQQIISLLTLLWQIIYLPLYNTLVKYYTTFFSLSYKINISILTSRIILSSELYLNQ